MNAEAHLSFACFGGTASVHVRAESTREGEVRADAARRRLLDAHRRLSRFSADSELTVLNRDPREEVPATPLLRSLAAAVRTAGSHSGGLVDATRLESVERAGYREPLGDASPVSLGETLANRPKRAPARPHPAARWRAVAVDEDAGTILRPAGVRIDSGGIAKGLLADLVGEALGSSRTYAVDCCGDLRLGGSAGLERRVEVDDPFGGGTIHTFSLAEGAVATSGIGRRSWIGPDGRPAHHIVDPASGEPAFTGLVQVTALAPTALLAEVYAKAALLSGPAGAAEQLPHGGVVVAEGGGVEVIAAERPLREAVAA